MALDPDQAHPPLSVFANQRERRDRPILSHSDGIHVIGPLPVGEEDRAVAGHASAKHVSVDDKTVAGWRAKIAPTVEIQQSTKREGADDGRRQALAGGLSPA